MSDDPAQTSDRRGADRRTGQRPFDGADRRVGNRRSGNDRRSAPRSRLMIDPND